MTCWIEPCDVGLLATTSMSISKMYFFSIILKRNFLISSQPVLFILLFSSVFVNVVLEDNCFEKKNGQVLGNAILAMF